MPTVVEHSLKAKFLELVFEGQVDKIEELINSPQEGGAIQSGTPPTEVLAAAFLLACRLGKLKVVHLLKDHVPPNVRTSDGMTGVMLAARHDNSEILKLLLTRDADPQLSDLSGRNALHWATIDGKLSNVRVLLDNGISLNEVDRSGSTALMYAVQFNRANLVQLLVKHGVDTHRPNRFKETPLHMACRFGYNNVVPRLLPYIRHFDLTDQWEQTPLMLACLHNHRSVIEQLVQHMSAVNLNAHKPGYPETSPLSLACTNRNLELARLLLKKGATPSEAALRLAASADSPEMIDLLHEFGACAKTMGHSALNSACEKGSVNACRRLLELGAPITTTSSSGKASMALAVTGSDTSAAVKCVGALLEFGANPSEPVSSTSTLPAVLLLLATLIEENTLAAAKSHFFELAEKCPSLPEILVSPSVASELAKSSHFGHRVRVAFVMLFVYICPPPKLTPADLAEGAPYPSLFLSYFHSQIMERWVVDNSVLVGAPPAIILSSLKGTLQLALDEACHSFLRTLLCACVDIYSPLPKCNLSPIACALLTENVECALLLAEAGADLSFLWHCHEFDTWPSIITEGRKNNDSMVLRMDSVYLSPRSLRDSARISIRRSLCPNKVLVSEADWEQLALPLPKNLKLFTSVVFDPMFIELYELIEGLSSD